MSVATLTPRVREACGVSTSYDDETIPALIRRCIQRLLRDYHFPKSVRRLDYDFTLDQIAYPLPAGFKKELSVQWYDSNGEGSWSDPLNKSNGFRRPQPDNFPRWYWLQGTDLVLDTPVTSLMNTFTLQLYYESMLVEDVLFDDGTTITVLEAGNESWFTTDFEDVLYYFAMTRAAAEFRKPEVAQTFAPLWQEEAASLAIYTNELEWGNVRMQAMEPRRLPQERYPR
jgi:hypothetical protein